ncbi:MAG: hypothetical protein SGI77_24550 [Pirellulaceae bacterium]|nr:hypothetical protein [Pirellulaceae bacterium]
MLVQQRQELPGPTTDLAQAKQYLREFGDCVIENALSLSEVKALKDRRTDQAAGERERGRAYLDGGNASMNQRVWLLVNKGKVFRDLMLHPLVVPSRQVHRKAFLQVLEFRHTTIRSPRKGKLVVSFGPALIGPLRADGTLESNLTNCTHTARLTDRSVSKSSGQKA